MPSAPAGDTEFFERSVRPLLVEMCLSCHGPDDPGGGLRLDAPPALSTDALREVLQNRSPSHPPVELSAAERETFLDWIGRGAPWPARAKKSYQRLSMDELIAVARRNHWAFRPVAEPALPAIGDTAWPRSPIDTYVLARLEKAGLSPAPRASRRTLVQRAYHDLIGLPPTLAEIEAFENDPAADAYDRLIARLLESPHFGERWGRHWLDVARYSDTKASAFNDDRLFPFSYTYRDYVIRAFNVDLPFDQFILHQLAADKLELGDDKRPLAALGFLTLGKVSGASIHDRIDDRIDVVTRGFLAMTVNCARCHDHKFDPIPTADYYSLYGVFRSSREPERLPVIAAPDTSSPAYRDFERRLAEAEAARDDLAVALRAKALETARGKAASEAEALESVQGNGFLKYIDQPDRVRLRQRDTAVDRIRNTHPARPDSAMALEDAPELYDPVIFVRGDAGIPGKAVPRQFLAVLDADRTPWTEDSGRLELARAIASKDNPLTARVFANRVWMHLFGAPLAGTPSDFGLQGEEPTHPELLDYLAARFMDSGWSTKTLIREIMLSSAYQQSSDASDAGQATDPENKLIWRQNRRRLGFEVMRDRLLAASGNLDLRMGGAADNITEPPFANRRTVYAEVDREALPAMFRIFDFATPATHTPVRFETTVPQQALYLMNSPFVAEQARLAAALPEVASKEAPAERVRALYQAILAREPVRREVELGTFFVDGQDVADVHIPERQPPRWLYGYGAIDEATGQVTSFTEFPHWTGEAYQGGETLPDAAIGYAMLNRLGGRPGGPQHAVIRRWISPADSLVSLVGELFHFSPAGDGIRAYVISSRSGILWQGDLQDQMLPTVVDDSEIRAGDTIDLVVTCKEDDQEDHFRWHPRIYLTGENASSFARQDWISRFDFEGPPPAPAVPLQPWEQYAQVLLMSNEFMFVD
ncbi:MAG: DUF1553 domain-containing protein [Candidatus Hydrogenedentes bacterium]|nr:DUF1553 domain-containing protein [Candidatus Hydrogenedentota bacterium]